MAYTGGRAASSASYYLITGSVVGVVTLYEDRDAVGRSFFNDTDKTCYVGFATTVSTGTFTTKISAQSFYEIQDPFYYGPVCLVWQTIPTTGSVLVTQTFT